MLKLLFSVAEALVQTALILALVYIGARFAGKLLDAQTDLQAIKYGVCTIADVIMLVGITLIMRLDMYFNKKD